MSSLLGVPRKIRGRLGRHGRFPPRFNSSSDWGNEGQKMDLSVIPEKLDLHPRREGAESENEEIFEECLSFRNRGCVGASGFEGDKKFGSGKELRKNVSSEKESKLVNDNLVVSAGGIS